jgi:PncC family amidohydrolase
MEPIERAERVGQLLVERGWLISVAESTADGLISAALLRIPGASRYFERGVVAYSRAAKLDTLGMPSTLYTAQGSVHREAVKAMAEGVWRMSGAQVGVGESGVVGPSGGALACLLAPCGPLW